MEQRENHYLFSTLNAAGKQSVNLVITSSERDGVLLDGEAILSAANKSSSEAVPSLNWTVIDTGSDVNYSAIQFSVDGGVHNLSHHYANALFAATSYGYPLGMRLLDLPSVADAVTYEIHTQNGTVTLYNGSVDLDGPPESNKKFPHKNYDNNSDEGISASVIAVIVSLCSGVFFVIACIVGFIVAEFLCNRENSPFSSSKVTPLNA